MVVSHGKMLIPTKGSEREMYKKEKEKKRKENLRFTI